MIARRPHRVILHVAVGLIAGASISSMFWARATGTAPYDDPISQAEDRPDEQPRWVNRPAAPRVDLQVDTPPPEVCPEGQLEGRYTQGRCCWLGQYWSSAERRCEGIPFSCPDGMMVRGEQCVVARGRMSRAEIWGHLQSTRSALRVCAQRAPEFRGVLWTRFLVGADGGLSEIEIKPVSGAEVEAHPELARCVVGVLSRHEVPTSRFAMQMFAYPVIFDGR